MLHEQEVFWDWFRDNGDRLRGMIYSGDRDACEAAFDELRAATDRVQPGLVLEFEPHGGAHNLVVSADGKLDRVDAVKDFVAAAPRLPGWNVIAFRPRSDMSGTAIQIGGEQVSPEDIWFKVVEDGYGLNLTLYVRGLTPENQRMRGLGASLLAEHAVGERDALTLLNSLKAEALPDPAPPGARPCSDLTVVFDAARERKYPPPGSLVVDTENDWEALEGTINGSPALVALNTGIRSVIGHPDYDRCFVVAIPFNEVRDDGFPATGAEFDTVQEIRNRIGEALEEGQQSLLAITVLSNGRRQMVFYSSDAAAALARLESIRWEVQSHRIEVEDKGHDTYWGMYTAFTRRQDQGED